jgi:hypothetical protein
MTVNVSGRLITVTSQIRGQATTRSFTRLLNDGQSRVTSIHLSGMNGDDIIRVEGNGGLPTFVNGNAGSDICDVQFAGRNFDNVGGEVGFSGGGGDDFAFLYDNANAFASTYTVFDSLVTSGLFRFSHDSENLTLHTGRGVDSVSVLSTGAGERLFLNNAAGNDTVNVGSLGFGLANVLGAVEVQNSPAFTTLNVTDAAGTVARRMPIINDGTFTTLTGTPAAIAWKNADTSAVNITTGTASDRSPTTMGCWRVEQPIDAGQLFGICSGHTSGSRHGSRGWKPDRHRRQESRASAAARSVRSRPGRTAHRGHRGRLPHGAHPPRRSSAYTQMARSHRPHRHGRRRVAGGERRHLGGRARAEPRGRARGAGRGVLAPDAVADGGA